MRLVLDARVDVFDVLADDDDVELAGFLHRRRHAFEVANRADAGVEVKNLAQGDVERADPPADGGRQGTLDGDPMLADDVERLVREPIAVLIERFLTGQHFAPHDAALAAGNLGNGVVEHLGGRAPDVGSGAVAFDEWDDGVVGDDPAPVPVVDLRADGAAAAAFNLCWHGPHLTTKRLVFGGVTRRNGAGLYGRRAMRINHSNVVLALLVLLAVTGCFSGTGSGSMGITGGGNNGGGNTSPVLGFFVQPNSANLGQAISP